MSVLNNRKKFVSSAFFKRGKLTEVMKRINHDLWVCLLKVQKENRRFRKVDRDVNYINTFKITIDIVKRFVET